MRESLAQTGKEKIESYRHPFQRIGQKNGRESINPSRLILAPTTLQTSKNSPIGKYKWINPDIGAWRK
jgi:hypothetical protein